MLRKSLVVILILAVVMSSGWLVYSQIKPVEYPATLKSPKQVYDGDTIKDVEVEVVNGSTPDGEVWPGIFKRGSAVYVKFSLRVAGIDTPEKRVSKKNRDGTARSEQSRSREKAASLAARDAVISLLRANKYQFVVVNPKIGKYAGRFVCDVEVNGQSLGLYLIEEGLAKAYDGGTKPDWGWGK